MQERQTICRSVLLHQGRSASKSPIRLEEAEPRRSGFDITNLVSWDWKGYALNAQPARDFYQEQGFLMVSSDETAVKQICSSEYTTTSYRPYVVMEYTAVIEIAGNSAIYLGTGDTRQLSYNTYPSDLEVSVTWSSDTPAVASVSSTGLVTGLSQGVAMISISATSATGAVITSGKLRVYVEDPFMDYKPWFIKGKNTKQFIGKSEESTNVADPIISGELINNFFPQWKIQYIPDYNYHLIVYGDRYFGVKQIDGSDVLSVGLYENNFTVECQWTIVPTGAETYKIYSQYSSQIDYYLCLKDGELILGTDETEGVDVSEWTIQDRVGAALLYFPGVDMQSGSYHRIYSLMNSLGATDVYTNYPDSGEYNILDEDQVFKRISSSEIVLLYGHGSPTGICLNCTEIPNEMDIVPIDTLVVSDVSTWEANALNKCKLILVSACSTANGGVDGDNFANALKNKGAMTVVAKKDDSAKSSLGNFTRNFYEQLSNRSNSTITSILEKITVAPDDWIVFGSNTIHR